MIVDERGEQLDARRLLRAERNGRSALFQLPDGVSAADCAADATVRNWIAEKLADR
jgi:hypothetical protein